MIPPYPGYEWAKLIDEMMVYPGAKLTIDSASEDYLVKLEYLGQVFKGDATDATAYQMSKWLDCVGAGHK